MQLQVAQGDSTTTCTADSEASKHFVVITNEIQWQGSAGTLLKRDAFDGQVRVTYLLHYVPSGNYLSTLIHDSWRSPGHSLQTPCNDMYWKPQSKTPYAQRGVYLDMTSDTSKRNSLVSFNSHINFLCIVPLLRALCLADRDVMNQKDFDTFWGWFGKNLQILRYQRHICHLWQQGWAFFL